NSTRLSSRAQMAHSGSIFKSTSRPSSTRMSSRSPCLMPSILRNSAGTTTRPNWSIRRAVPIVLTSVPPRARPPVPTRKGLPAWAGWAEWIISSATTRTPVGAGVRQNEGNMSRFYVTTPIYYVNDVPHIGHAYTTVAGDVLTRWRRLWGDEVFYLTGTDEHGLKVQRAAEARGVSPKELVDETAGHFRDTWDGLDIAYDDFIRTTEPRHYAAVQKFLQTIYDAGDIELGTYEGLYCVSCEAYYAEDELVDGCCPIHLRPVEHVVEEHYFFKLSRFTDRLLAHYAEHPAA